MFITLVLESRGCSYEHDRIDSSALVLYQSRQYLLVIGHSPLALATKVTCTYGGTIQYEYTRSHLLAQGTERPRAKSPVSGTKVLGIFIRDCQVGPMLCGRPV